MTKPTTDKVTRDPNAAEDVNRSDNAAEVVILITIPANNIKFVGRQTWDKHRRKVLKDPQPIERITGGDGVIDLPPADFQISRRLFYHKAARLIVRRFPHLYKNVISKTGAKTK